MQCLCRGLAIAAGGQWQGFRIARSIDAQRFVDAMVGANTLTTTGRDALAFGPSDAETLVGESFQDYRAQYGYDWDTDLVAFLGGSDEQRLGLIELSSHDKRGSSLQKDNDWAAISWGDGWLDGHTGWLLYRDLPSSSVPEPATLLLAAAAMLGAARRRRLR